MAFARDTYTSAGEATYTITFPYLSSSHVNLFVNGTSKTFTLDNSTTLRPDTTPTSGDTVLITRTSSQGSRLTDYVDGSVFKAETLDDDLLQAFYIAQEALDESTLVLGLTSAGDAWDAESKEIENLTGGTDSGDAVEYDQMVNYVASVGGVPDPSAETSGTILISNGSTVKWANNADGVAAYRLEHDLATAAAGPDLQIIRDSDSPADADLLGTLSFVGVNDNATPQEWIAARVGAKALDITDDTEDGELVFSCMVDGTLTDKWRIGQGLYAEGNSDPGVGKIDADDLLISGVGVPMEADNNTWTGLNVGTYEQWTDAATVTATMSGGNNFYVTVGGDRTIGQPTGEVNGQSGYLIVEQDGTGGRVTSWHADWNFKDGDTPTEDTTADAKNVYAYTVDWDGEVHIAYIGVF